MMQKAVVRAIHSKKVDPLSEQDLAEHFEQFLNDQRLSQDSIVQCISSLRPQVSHREIPETIELSEDVVQDPAPIEVSTQITQVAHPAVKRQRRTDIWGRTPKKDGHRYATCWSQVFIFVGLARNASERYTGWVIVLPSQGLIISTTITWSWLCRNVRLMTSYADSVRGRMHARQERVPALRRVHPPLIRISEWQGILT